MAQSQLRTASGGPKFRRSGNFLFLRCFGFTGGKRKTNFKKKSPTDATKKPHWFGFSSKKKKYAAANTNTNTFDKTDHRCDLKPNSTDESKLIIKNSKLDSISCCKDMVEDEGKCQNPLFSGVRTDNMLELPAEKSIPADHIFLPPVGKQKQGTSVSVAKTNSKGHRKSEVMWSERVDPSVGFFIVTLNLVIMLVWGKVCAILCASAFLYIVPRFRASRTKRDRQSGSGSGPIAVSSLKGNSDDSLIKSKVVFHGFLDRKRPGSFAHR